LEIKEFPKDKCWRKEIDWEAIIGVHHGEWRKRNIAQSWFGNEKFSERIYLLIFQNICVN
jgi:hypothetical protein